MSSENVTDLNKNSKVPPLESGDVVYSDKITKFTEKGRQLFHSGGSTMYVSVLLGRVKSRHELADNDMVMALMGSVGFIGTDDIAEALGAEATEKVIAYVQQKYSPEGTKKNEPAPPKLLVTLGEAKDEGINVV